VLTPSHSKKVFIAKRAFTGRQEERNLFSDACKETDVQDSYKVLMWYGVGGQGKSSLLREFVRFIATRNEASKSEKSKHRLIPAKIDFEDERLKRIDNALYSLRLQLGQSSGFTFHTFDTAFITYFKKTRPGIDIPSTFPELVKGEKEGMMDLIDVLDDPLTVASHLASAALPGAGLLYKWGMRLTGKLASWWRIRGNEALAGIEQLQPEQLLEKLPSYLGVDICDGIRSKPEIRPVIFLDTYEALWRDRGQKDALADRRADEWVRLLVQDAPGTMFVIAGRDKLRWGEIDDAWNEVIDAHLLGGLSDEDADKFLIDVPIDEERIRETIVGSSNGLPFYLNIQVSQYEAIREIGESPEPIQFGGTSSDILSRFLEHLSDVDQGALRMASYLHVITRDVMDDLAEAFPNRAINYSFNRMAKRSSFVEISADVFEIHALMKEELQQREKAENEEFFRKVHRYLFDWFNDRISRESSMTVSVREDRGAKIPIALSHAKKGSQFQVFDWLMEMRQLLDVASEWSILEHCYQMILGDRESLKMLDEMSLRTVENNYVCVLHSQGKHELAYQEFARLQTLKDAPAHVLKILKYNRALILSSLGQYDEAERQISAIGVSEHRLPSNGDEFTLEATRAKCLLNYRKGDLGAAEMALRALARATFDNFGVYFFFQAYVLNDLSNIVRLQGRFSEAERLFQYSCLVGARLAHSKTPDDGGDDAASVDFKDIGNFDVLRLHDFSEPLMRRVWFDRLPSICRNHDAFDIFDARSEHMHPEITSAELLEALDGSEYIDDMNREHRHATRFKNQLIRFLDGLRNGIEFQAFMETGRVKLKFLRGKKSYCWFDVETKTVISVVDENQSELGPFNLLALYGDLYFSMVCAANIYPPPPYAGLAALARFHHGLNLDIYCEISKILTQSNSPALSEFEELASPGMISFVKSVEQGLSRDDLYQDYAKIEQRWNDKAV
jgi:hypothetical protein